MSKRFGRNQKRKLQRETEQLREAFNMAAGLQQNTTRELQRARDALQIIYHEIAKNLNPCHPLLPAEVRKQFAVGAIDVYAVQLPIDRLVVKTVDVLRRRYLTDEYRQQVAVKLRHGQSEVAYAVDIKALQVESFREEFIDEFAREIADRLTRFLQKCGG